LQTLKLVEGILSMLGLDDLKAALAQREADHLPHRNGIIDNQYFSHFATSPEDESRSSVRI